MVSCFHLSNNTKWNFRICVEFFKCFKPKEFSLHVGSDYCRRSAKNKLGLRKIFTGFLVRLKLLSQNVTQYSSLSKLITTICFRREINILLRRMSSHSSILIHFDPFLYRKNKCLCTEWTQFQRENGAKYVMFSFKG